MLHTHPRRHADAGLRAATSLLTCCLLLLLAPTSAAAPGGPDPFEFSFSELAPGVWAGVRDDATRLPVMGNTLFVVTDEGVVVFDGGGLALMSERLLEQIAAVTDQPVTHIGISHWHGDHSFGIWAILQRYPQAEVVASSFTRAALLGSPVAYIDGYADFRTGQGARMRRSAEQGVTANGEPLPDTTRRRFLELVEHFDLVATEYERARVSVPTLSFDERLVLHRGGRTIEFLCLGAGNTEGDMLLWLPDERLVATGDLVVLPTPFLFNVPPRAWSATLARLNALDYETLVPGHGAVQHDTRYVDLLIELADSIADQRDALLAEGLAGEEVRQALDFSAFEARFTGGDATLTQLYRIWTEGPFRQAALKALGDEPMVVIGPRHPEDG